MNRNVNFNLLKEFAGTQYGDMTGIIQIDGHTGVIDIFKLCEDNGIDTENNFVLAFGMSESTLNGIGQKDSVRCRVLLLPREEYGTTYDDIKAHLLSNGRQAKVGQSSFTIKYTSLTQYIKRFDFIVSSDLIQYIDSIDIAE